MIIALKALVLLLVSSVLLFQHGINGVYIHYNTTVGPVEGKLNVHLVTHTHNEVGWLKTVDQYYIGSNDSLQLAQPTCVRNILDSLVYSLQEDLNRKFVYVEQILNFMTVAWMSLKVQHPKKSLLEARQLVSLLLNNHPRHLFKGHASPVSAASGMKTCCCNLDHCMESTTPTVPLQYLPKTFMKGWRDFEAKSMPFFSLGDLWESFNEWSAYGARVPIVLNRSDTVMQYYVPSLSAIQLCTHPFGPNTGTRSPGEESDASDDYRDTGSKGSSSSDEAE